MTSGEQAPICTSLPYALANFAFKSLCRRSTERDVPVALSGMRNFCRPEIVFLCALAFRDEKLRARRDDRGEID